MDAAQLRDIRRVQHETRTAAYGQALASWPTPVRFTLIVPQVDEYGQALFGRWGGWLLGINEMLVNERLVLWLESEGGTAAPNVPMFGWCYPKRGTALLALAAFDPATMGEPVGFTKRALGERRPGLTADMFVADRPRRY